MCVSCKAQSHFATECSSHFLPQGLKRNLVDLSNIQRTKTGFLKRSSRMPVSSEKQRMEEKRTGL